MQKMINEEQEATAPITQFLTLNEQKRITCVSHKQLIVSSHRNGSHSTLNLLIQIGCLFLAQLAVKFKYYEGWKIL